MSQLLCGDCNHPKKDHAEPLRSSPKSRGIAWCRVKDCMCRGFVIDAEAEVTAKTPS